MNRWPGYIVAYIDMLLAMVVIGIVFMVITVKEDTYIQKPVCVMAVDVEWPTDYDVDVDLWAAGPDKKPVGYSAKESPSLYIGADDVRVIPGEKHNDERVCARVLRDGEYIVNVHMFSNIHHLYPVPVNVEIALVDPASATQQIIISKTVELKTYAEELTVVRFLMKDGKLVPGSMYDLPYKLRGSVAGGNGR